MNSTEQLKAQRIATVSNGGHTYISRKVTGLSRSHGMEYGFIGYLGGTYRVARIADQPYWEVRDRIILYPAGHPLQSLNMEAK